MLGPSVDVPDDCPMTRQIRFNAFDMNCVAHQSSGMWRHPDDRSANYKDLSYWTELARLLESGTFDGIFIADVLGTTSDQLYRTERSATTGPGSFSYGIPVPSPGQYQVKLHFAEIYHGATGGGAGGTGKRVFSVNMEGGPVEISNLDLNAVVAPMTAYITTHTISVTDGTLNIGFSSTIDQPKVSAIEIVKVP